MIQLDPEQLEQYGPRELPGLLQKALPILQHRRNLYARYARKKSPDQMIHGQYRDGREQAVVAFEYYIVNMAQGYLGGKAPMYRVSCIHGGQESGEAAHNGQGVSSREKQQDYAERYAQAIDRIRRYNDDAATVLELFHDYLITNAAYLYLWEDEDNEIRYGKRDSLQTAAIFDYSTPPNPIGAVETWMREGDGGKQFREVVLTTRTKKTTFLEQGEGFQITGEEALQWGDAPVVPFENPDGIAVFEPALSMIDTYEQLVTNVRDMTQYNDEAKLLMSGYTSSYEAGTEERAEEERAIMKAPVVFVGENGSVSWLLKEVKYDGLLSILRCLHDQITMLTGVPNMTDEAFSNADNASALGYKLYALDQYSAAADRVFRKGYLRLWELITGRLNLKGADFDFRDIEIVMQRNLPTDRDKSIDRAVRAYQGGLLSQESAINESQIEVDAKEEMARMKQEQAEDFQEIQARTGEGTTPANSDNSNQREPDSKGGQKQ